MEKKVWINFRSTEEEKERLKKDAHRHEMTVTEYLKWLIEREREVMKNDTMWGLLRIER